MVEIQKLSPRHLCCSNVHNRYLNTQSTKQKASKHQPKTSPNVSMLLNYLRLLLLVHRLFGRNSPPHGKKKHTRHQGHGNYRPHIGPLARIPMSSDCLSHLVCLVLSLLSLEVEMRNIRPDSAFSATTSPCAIEGGRRVPCTKRRPTATAHIRRRGALLLGAAAGKARGRPAAYGV